MIKRLTLILALLFAQPAWAAWAILDAFSSNEAEDCDPCTADFTISAGSNRKFICMFGSEDTSTPLTSGVTFGGVAMQLVLQIDTPTASNGVEMYYLDDASLPAPGSHTVSANYPDSIIDWGITCGSVSGIAQGAPKDTDQFESDSASTTTLSLTGIVATDLIITAAVHNSAANSWAHGGSQTELSDFCFGQTVASGCMGTSRATGITDPSSTTSGATGDNRFAMIAAAWAEAASTFVPMGGHAQQID